MKFIISMIFVLLIGGVGVGLWAQVKIRPPATPTPKPAPTTAPKSTRTTPRPATPPSRPVRGKTPTSATPVNAPATETTLSAPADAPAPPALLEAVRMSAVGAPLMAFSFETVTMDARGRITERRREHAWGYTEDLGNGVKLEMVEIPEGTFLMGSLEMEGEKPRHQVAVPAFAMGKYEITKAQWWAVTHLPEVEIYLYSEPSMPKEANLPVKGKSWWEAVEFCKRLSRATGRPYRLPSEAEWEYACRGGTKTPFAFGEAITTEIVNYWGKKAYKMEPTGLYRQETVPVGSLGVANGFGLYDMHGNVYEWCLDLWNDNYKGAPVDGSSWDSGRVFPQSPFFHLGTDRVLRGGSWNAWAGDCRCASRYALDPDRGSNNFAEGGFRVVASARKR